MALNTHHLVDQDLEPDGCFEAYFEEPAAQADF